MSHGLGAPEPPGRESPIATSEPDDGDLAARYAALARQRHVMSTAIRHLTSVHDPLEVLDAAVRLAAELISPSITSERRAVYFVPDGEEARIAAEFDEAGHRARSPVALADHPPLARVVRTGLTTHTTFEPDGLGPTARASVGVTGITNGAAVPVRVNGVLHGVLAVGGRGRPIAEIDALEDLAAVVELALSNALVTAELAAQATTDALTGCANRRGLTDAARSVPSRRPYSVIAADLDGLKQINDEQGHDAGDAALCQFAERVQGVLRTGDLLARVGGDEFVMILHGADRAEADRVARRITAAVSAGPLHLSVSLGIATTRRGPPGFAAAWEAADSAMYDAKRTGGMTWMHGPPPV